MELFVGFRKKFRLHRWESVKQHQFCCGVLDFKHRYDLQI